MKNNKKKTRMTKVEKRRLAFEKRNVKKEQNLARYGAEDGSALVMAKTTEFNRRVIAVVLALVFVLTTLIVGINVVTNANTMYEEEDAPIEMRVMVNDEWLKQDTTNDAVTVQFPSALIENGVISEGIAYQKKNDEGDILVNSIQEQIDNIVFGDQSGISDNERKSVNYKAAYVNKANGESEEISNVRISENGDTQYLTKDATADANWASVNGDDILLLSFDNPQTEPAVVDADNNTILLESIDDSISVKQDGSIPDSNGILPSMVKGLFKASSLKSASHLEAVDFNVLYNVVPRDDLTISVPAGDVEANMNSSAVKTQEEEKLAAKAIWKKAVIWKWDSSENTYIQYEVKNVGKYEDAVYYSIEGDNEDTGILLGANDKLYLQYELYFDVSYVITPEEGGNVVGSTTKVAYGKSLPVNVNANTYYHLSSLSYNIQTGSSSYKYGAAQPVSNQTIPATEIVGDVVIYADFTRDTSYNVNGDNIDHGHICGSESLGYEASDNGAISQYGNPDTTDTMRGMQHGVVVTAGGNAYLVMYGQKPSKSTSTYFLNVIWLEVGGHKEEVKVPTTYSMSSSASERKVETPLTYAGSKATVELVATDAKDSHLATNNARNAERYKYIIKIENVKSDFSLSTYFRPYAKTIMYLKGLRGIANTAAAYPVDTYLLYIGSADNNANNALYFLDENNSSKNIQHMYSSYDKDKLAEKVQADSHIDDKFLFLGHQLDHFHFHNAYLFKVKPGYNANHVAYSDLLGNYIDRSSLLNSAKRIKINSATTNASFQQAYDEKDYYVNIWGNNQYYYYCWWDTKLTSSNIATVNTQVGRYTILTNEVDSDTFFDTRTAAAAKTYVPFLTGAKQQHYYSGILLPELNYYNNSLEINAFAYKYKIQYFVNGQDQSGQAVNATYNNIDTATHEFESGNNTFKEINRHSVEIANNPSSSAVANEFDGVTTDDVIIPKEPLAIDNENYRYSFQYWKLVKCDSLGNYVSDVTKDGKILKYTPGETFSLTNDAVGAYTSPASALTGYSISLADYAVTSGDAASGYAWGDYNSADDNALTFTFMPVWQSTPIGNYLHYSVLAYKDTPNGALTDGDGNPITSVKNGRTYYLYYNNENNKAAPNSEIVSLNQHYPNDGYSYKMNENLTDEKIDSLTTGTDDQIVYYYNVENLPVTIRETVDGIYSYSGDKFDLTLTLTPPDDIDSEALPETISLNEETTASKQDNNSYIAVISNKEGNGEKTSLSIPFGYTLKVSSSAVGKSYYEEPIMKYAQGEDPDATTGTAFTSDTGLSITQNTDILIHNICNEIPITGIQRHKNAVMIILVVLVTLAGCAGAAYVYRKKDEFVEK